jgi:glycosyltransferase involved in cell wall biosynthesis
VKQRGTPAKAVIQLKQIRPWSMSPLSSSAGNGTLDDADASKPAISLIVAVDQVSPGVLRSLTAMRDAVADDRVELIAATAELWPGAPSWVNVVTFNGASRGDRLDRAAEHATGELLAFTDDRVRIPDGWVREVLAVFADPSVGVAGGPVLPRARWRGERTAALITERFLGGTPSGHTSRMDRPRPVRELAGSNLVIRRDWFWAVGGFQSPSAGGEALRLCYKVRSLLERDVQYRPTLAVTRAARRFPGPFLKETAVYGRARGDLARRCPDVSPLLPHGLPALVPLLVGVELLLAGLGMRRVALAGAIMLAAAYVVVSGRVLFGSGRLGDRLLAILGLPLVPFTFGVAFVRGYLGPSLGEVSPLRNRQRPLRILIINWRDVTHPWAGGAETYMHEIGRRWAEQGMDVGWLCQRHKGSAERELIDGIRFHRAGGRLTVYLKAPLLYMRRLRDRYDVIVDCENGIPFFSPLFARVPTVLVVHHVHQEIFRREMRPPMRWLGLWLEGSLMPRVYRGRQVVAVSASTKDDLGKLGFDASVISVVHNGVFPGPELDVRPSRTPAILCMGRLTPQKSVDVLIRALPAVLLEFPNARLDIVGQGPDRRRLEALAWSLRLAEHVRFHGYVAASTRDEIAARAWVAVCPSSFEGWGVICSEAGARGLPVIASNVAGLRDAVRDGETGVLVPHGDHGALAVALVGMLANPERRQRMGEEGRRWAALHSWDKSAGDLRTVLAAAVIGSPIEALAARWLQPLTTEDRVEELEVLDAM